MGGQMNLADLAFGLVLVTGTSDATPSPSNAVHIGPKEVAAAHPGSAGVCVRLDGVGRVAEAKVVDSSGDMDTDDAALQIARELHWDFPYPPAGWIGLNMQAGDGPEQHRPLPACDDPI